jgi:4a-hydroxytetrahydrobiopterin dehydratase
MSATHTFHNLSAKKCSACEGNVERVSPEEAKKLLRELAGWRLSEEGDRIRKEWRMKNFMAAIEFFGCVAELAESEGHHPDLHLENYRNARIELSTHSIGGLSENDFILAAKIDSLEGGK